MCDKAVEIPPSVIQLVPEYFKTQDMCDRAVDSCPFLVDSLPDQFKTQNMRDEAFLEDPLTLKYCLDRYKTQEMCGKAVDDFWPILKFVRDWLVTSKTTKKNYNALSADDDLRFLDEDTGKVSFLSDEMGFLSGNINKINLYDDSFYENDPKTIIYVRILA